MCALANLVSDPRCRVFVLRFESFFTEGNEGKEGIFFGIPPAPGLIPLNDRLNLRFLCYLLFTIFSTGIEQKATKGTKLLLDKIHKIYRIEMFRFIQSMCFILSKTLTAN